MKASVVDLRYKMKDVLRALDRKEEVTILYRGKVKGRIIPSEKKVTKKVKDHSFFGMATEKDVSVAEELERLRTSRVDDI